MKTILVGCCVRATVKAPKRVQGRKISAHHPDTHSQAHYICNCLRLRPCNSPGIPVRLGHAGLQVKTMLVRAPNQ
jgi:hypothetical protein